MMFLLFLLLILHNARFRPSVIYITSSKEAACDNQPDCWLSCTRVISKNYGTNKWAIIAPKDEKKSKSSSATQFSKSERL